MRYPLLLPTVIACWIAIVAAQAQTNPTPGMGPTSPLGANNAPLGANASVSDGIPLGSTGINTPGISPLIMPCPNTSSNTAFDGGGSAQSNNCGPTSTASGNSAATSMSGAGPINSGAPGSLTTSGVVGANIPLGATDLGIPGESQVTPVPGVTPCLQSVTPSQPATPSPGSSAGIGFTSSTVNGGC